VICGAEGVNKCKICCYTVYHAVNLGAIARGAKTLYLGATVRGAEFRVRFLKYFQKRRTYENLSKKGQKEKKSRSSCSAGRWQWSHSYRYLCVREEDEYSSILILMVLASKSESASNNFMCIQTSFIVL
jgi:hypothetical protein